MLGRSIQRCRSLLPQLRGRCTPWCHMPCFSANTGPACGIGKLATRPARTLALLQREQETAGDDHGHAERGPAIRKLVEDQIAVADGPYHLQVRERRE